MKLIVREDYNECSRYLADRFEEVIRRKPDAFLGLATGSSPEGMYRYLCEDHRKGLIDLSAVSTINLDEYAGLPREHDQSFGYYMDRHFFSKVNIDERNIHLINGAGDISEEISRYEELLAEINAVSDYCRYSTLKAIVETCLLTQEEKVKLCDVVSASRAQYIETSTGFSAGGATVVDTELLAKNMRGLTLVKAAGGIRSLADALAMIEAGATRLGTSAGVKIMQELDAQ